MIGAVRFSLACVACFRVVCICSCSTIVVNVTHITKFSIGLPEVASEFLRFIKPFPACVIFESERKNLVLTKLLHVRIGRLVNLHSFCPEIRMVASDFLQLYLLFPPARGLLQSSCVL